MEFYAFKCIRVLKCFGGLSTTNYDCICLSGPLVLLCVMSEFTACLVSVLRYSQVLLINRGTYEQQFMPVICFCSPRGKALTWNCCRGWTQRPGAELHVAENIFLITIKRAHKVNSKFRNAATQSLSSPAKTVFATVVCSVLGHTVCSTQHKK